MASIRNLKENNGNVFYPLTHERAVKDSNGVSLESKLAGLESKSYVEAWDGTSTPVVANIPAGVVVTYNSTNYIGTLAASASTIGKIYLVKNGSAYDRYITSQSGSSYSWASIGSTELDLSGYATDAELAQLDQKFYDIETVDGSTLGTLQNSVIGGDGAISANGSYRTRVIPNNGYERVSGHGSSYANFSILAFYNSATPSAATLISNIKATTNYVDQSFDTEVPAGTVTIAVGYTTYSQSTEAEITFTAKALITGKLSDEIDTLADSVSDIEDNVTTLDEKVETQVFTVDYISGKDLSGYKIDGYLAANGQWNPAATIQSVKVPVVGGDVIRMDGVTDMTGMSILGRGLKKDGTTFDIQPNSSFVGDLGDGSYMIEIPANIAFQYVAFSWLSSLSVSVYKTSTIVDTSLWKGKIWAGLGDSLTEQSYEGLSWSPSVEDATGLVFKNCGVGSTCLAGSASSAFWKRLSAVEGYNPDLVTILGGANDLYSDIPIGTDAEFSKTVANKDCNTFIGAYSYIIESLLTWKKTLRLVLLTTSYAHNDGADHTPGIGLTYKDYANATIRVAEYYGLPVVDLYRNMGINKITQDSTYTRGDNIHWNARASQIVASLVIAKLNEINNAIM